MSVDKPPVKSAKLLQWQLQSVPVLNSELTVTHTDAGRTRLSLPLAHRKWSRLLQRILPLSNRRTVELDELGAQVFELIDGNRTLEEIIDLHMQRWLLSFFEARAMILQFLRPLLRYQFVALAAPEPDFLDHKQ